MPGPQAWDSGKCLFVASKPTFLFFLTQNSGFLKARVTARAAHVRGRRRGHLEASLRGPLRLGLRVRCPPCAVTSASTGRAPLLPPLLGLSSWRSRSPPRRLLLHPRRSRLHSRRSVLCVHAASPRGPYAGAPLPSRHCPSHGPGVSVLSSLQRRPLLKRLRPLLRADPVARHPEPSSQRQPLNSRSS